MKITGFVHANGNRQAIVGFLTEAKILLNAQGWNIRNNIIIVPCDDAEVEMPPNFSPHRPNADQAIFVIPPDMFDRIKKALIPKLQH